MINYQSPRLPNPFQESSLGADSLRGIARNLGVLPWPYFCLRGGAEFGGGAMKFGKVLLQEAEPGWRYVDYAQLKTRLKDLVEKNSTRRSKHANTFSQQLVEELQAVEAFFHDKQAQAREELHRLQNDLYVCEGWVESNYPDTEEHLEKVSQGFTNLGLLVAKLLHYLELNVTATRKIIKKYSHVTGHHAGPSLLSGPDMFDLERLSDPFELSEIVIAVQAGLERSRMLSAVLRNRQASRKLVSPLYTSASETARVSGGGYGSLPRVSLSPIGDTDDDDSAPEDANLMPRRSEARPVLRRGVSTNSQNVAPVTFEQFLASQLLVSDRTHKHLAAELELSQARVNRKPRLEYLHNIVQQYANSAGRIRRGLNGEESNEEEEDESKSLIALVVGLLLLVLLYSINLGSIAPYNLFYAEVTTTPIGSSAFSFAAIRLCSLVCVMATASSSRRAFPAVIVVTAIALIVGNLLYASVFSTFFEHGPRDAAGDPGDPKIVEDRAAHTDVMLLAGFTLMGVGGFLLNVLPALACGSPSIVLAHRVEKVAGMAIATAAMGDVVGRSISACTTSWDYAEEAKFKMFLINGLSLPALGISALWLVIVACMVLPWVIHLMYRACCIPANISDIDLSSNDSNPLYAGISSILSADYLKRFNVATYAGIRASESAPIPDWTFGLILLGVTGFAQTMVVCVTIVNLQMVFSAAWPAISVIALASSVVVLPMWYLTLQLVNSLGARFVLRASLLATAILTGLMLPMNGLETSYDLAYFLILASLLHVSLIMLRSVSSFGLCHLFERGVDDAPLSQYGLLGPIIASETSRYCGEAAAYTLLGLTLRETVYDPLAMINYTLGAVFVFLATCWLAILSR